METKNPEHSLIKKIICPFARCPGTSDLALVILRMIILVCFRGALQPLV